MRIHIILTKKEYVWLWRIGIVLLFLSLLVFGALRRTYE